MSVHFSDHFSGHASEYAKARPTYPSALFRYLSDLAPANDCAWDCATGSGQAAVALSDQFTSVIATDASAEQIAQATPAANVDYRIAPAEASGIEPDSVDLVTVAQAVHWFDFSRFFMEVDRVTKERAVIALWSYGLTRINVEVDAIISTFYESEISSYWPKERSHVESEYRDIPFPYESCNPPEFVMSVDWSADDLLAYLRTWSSVKRFEAATGHDPVFEITDDIRNAWIGNTCSVIWPLILRVGRCN
ncbi:MAG: hypothetical protein ACI9R3_000401 [Verrucomicrobiales bacterium]|jgi:hypothetical protein